MFSSANQIKTKRMHDIRGRTVLVIGGAGFIGSHVVDELLNEDVKQVVVYDNFWPPGGTVEASRRRTVVRWVDG